MRNIVEQHEAYVDRIFEVQYIQAGGGLVEAVTIATRVEAKQTADKQPQGSLMGNNNHVLSMVGQYNPPDDRQGAGNHIDTCLTTLRCKCKRVFLPGSVFIRKLRFHIGTAHPL